MMQHIKYNVCVYELLRGKYDDILESMILDENFFIIQDKIYDFFYEITYYGKIVGFIAGNISNNSMICELVYILKKYRNYSLFSESLKSLDNIFKEEIVLFLPNHYVMLSLLHNNLSFKITENILFSKYKLCFDRYDTDVRVYSFLYDLKNCCIISLSDKSVSPLLDDDISVLPSGRIDDINEDYFKKIYDELYKLL